MFQHFDKRYKRKIEPWGDGLAEKFFPGKTFYFIRNNILLQSNSLFLRCRWINHKPRGIDEGKSNLPLTTGREKNFTRFFFLLLLLQAVYPEGGMWRSQNAFLRPCLTSKRSTGTRRERNPEYEVCWWGSTEMN